MSIKKLSEFQCAVTVIQGELYYCPIDSFGSVPMIAGCIDWLKVEPPLKKGFLDAVNQALKTSFKEEDFKPRG